MRKFRVFLKLRAELLKRLTPFPKTYIFTSRYFYPPLHVAKLLSRNTQIIIEGFPRSANTFAFVAFMNAQDEPVVVAHHNHDQAMVSVGVKLGIPALILIRKPNEAVRSLMAYHPTLDVATAYRQYLAFYSEMEKIKEKVVIADFVEVTENFGEVIERVNQKFDTKFGIFMHTKEQERSVFKKIDAFNQIRHSGSQAKLAMPNEGRRAKISEVVINPPLDLERDSLALYSRLSPLSAHSNSN